jgi:outer membrane immunogenic protein
MKLRLTSVLASLLVVGGLQAAAAADMAVKYKAPPIVAPIYNWTGFYIGGNVGGAWNDSRDDVYPTGCFLTSVTCGGGPALNPLRSDSVRLNGSGFVGGGQAGYNWQRDRWVFGVEGDINYNGVNDSSFINRPVGLPLIGNYIHSETDKLQWFGTFRGRVGVTVTPSFLIYGTGGLAFGGVKSASATSFTATADTYAGSNSDTRAGWTAGGGGEWMIAPQWSIKAEYLYIDLGKTGYAQACTNLAVCGSPPQVAPGGSWQTDLHVREHVARVGLNYHFGGPIVAKY